MITTINPATGQPLAQHGIHPPEALEATLAAAASAQRSWAKVPIRQRVQLLTSVAVALRKNKDHFANLITQEMGKPIVEAEAEIEKSAWTCDFYAEAAEAYLADIPVKSNASESRVVFSPLGVVLAVMPWNYPFWQFIRFAAPALAAGNATLLKHANNVPQCALALEAVFREAGASVGLVSTLLIDASTVSSVLSDSRVAAVTLTGSTAVGKLVASQAASLMKKQVLELGGSDPFIVLADADLEAAAAAAVKARFSNTGQSCISAKRFIVQEEVADRFVQLFCEGVRELKVGDPQNRGTTVGPMARASLREELHAQVLRTLDAGATLAQGGHFIQGPGFFYEPTVLDHVSESMAAATEETFGPVAAVMRVRNADEAVSLANNTEFGLGASIWTSNVEHGVQLALQIEAGAVFVNGLVASDPRLPFGGVKQSGYGRELGEFGIREFTNIKTLWIGPVQQ